MSIFAREPIMNVEWQDAQTLRANGWNPNVVFRPELRLLELSILRTGWVQPILINRDLLIIDGFHRWSLSKDSNALKAKYKGQVPCVVMNISDPEAMLLTVRINRAKGSHAAVRMSDLVRTLVDTYGYTAAQIEEGIGAGPGEVQLLLERDVFKSKNLAAAPYSQAWVPRESRHNKEKV